MHLLCFPGIDRMFRIIFVIADPDLIADRELPAGIGQRTFNESAVLCLIADKYFDRSLHAVSVEIIMFSETDDGCDSFYTGQPDPQYACQGSQKAACDNDKHNQEYRNLEEFIYTVDDSTSAQSWLLCRYRSNSSGGRGRE